MPLKISIITATFNSEDTICNCLNSFNSQSWINKEHIIIDGKSTDNTIPLIKMHHSPIDLIFISEEDSGIYEALNKGIKLATGDIIGFLHFDDLFANKIVIEKVVNEFNDPNINVVYGDLLYVRKSNPNITVRRWKSTPFNFDSIKYGWMPPLPTLYVHKNIYRDSNLFDESLKISADYKSILSILTKNSTISKYIPEVLIKMRFAGASNKSLKNIVTKYKEDYRSLRFHKFDFLSSLIVIFSKNIRKTSQFF